MPASSIYATLIFVVRMPLALGPGSAKASMVDSDERAEVKC